MRSVGLPLRVSTPTLRPRFGTGAPQGAASAATPATGQAPKPREALRILIVEDDFFIAMAFEQLAQSKGFTNVTVKTNLQEGLEAAQTGAFDIAFVDHSLEMGNTGMPIIAELKRQGIAVASISSHDDHYLSSEARRHPGVSWQGIPVLGKDFDLFEAKGLARWRHLVPGGISD